jgi:hypothetical protein
MDQGSLPELPAAAKNRQGLEHMVREILAKKVRAEQLSLPTNSSKYHHREDLGRLADAIIV